MSEVQYENRTVKIMCIEPKGIWAMVRRKEFPNSMPFVVRVKELIFKQGSKE